MVKTSVPILRELYESKREIFWKNVLVTCIAQGEEERRIVLNDGAKQQNKNDTIDPRHDRHARFIVHGARVTDLPQLCLHRSRFAMFNQVMKFSMSIAHRDKDRQPPSPRALDCISLRRASPTRFTFLDILISYPSTRYPLHI